MPFQSLEDGESLGYRISLLRCFPQTGADRAMNSLGFSSIILREMKSQCWEMEMVASSKFEMQSLNMRNPHHSSVSCDIGGEVCSSNMFQRTALDWYKVRGVDMRFSIKRILN